MELNIRILHTNGSIEKRTVTTADVNSVKYISDITVPLCTALRKADQSIASVKIYVPGYAQPIVWVGNYTKEHAEAIAKAERENVIW